MTPSAPDQLRELPALLGSDVTLAAPLAPFCTYKVGGAAAALVSVTSVATLESLHKWLQREFPAGSGELPILVVGRGSNLLVADAGFPGVVLRLGEEFSEVVVDARQAELRVGGAAALPVASRKSAAAGLTGFEWAVGVPGSVGGAVRMNAGGHGSDVASNLVRASVFSLSSGGPVDRTKAQLDLGYRTSNLSADDIVLFAQFQLAHGDRDRAEAEISEIVAWRRANQPGGQNAGSVFRNPPNDSAGRLIEAAGLKGLRVGTAEISSKHANFIQAGTDGSADDVFALITEVRRLVSDRFGVDLHPENHLIGFTTPDT